MARPVGAYLKDMNSVTSEQLVESLRSQAILKDSGKKKFLGELLIESGYITKEQLDEALNKQEVNFVIYKLLKENGHITKEQLDELLSKHEL